MCQHCHESIKPRHSLICTCKGATEGRERVEREKLPARAAKAARISVPEAITAGVELVYSEGHTRYYSFDELDDVEPEERESLDILWATKPRDLRLDADDILESVAEKLELHEDAVENIGKDAIKELQQFVDGWAARHGRYSRTFFPDYSRMVVIDEVLNEATSV